MNSAVFHQSATPPSTQFFCLSFLSSRAPISLHHLASVFHFLPLLCPCQEICDQSLAIKYNPPGRRLSALERMEKRRSRSQFPFGPAKQATSIWERGTSNILNLKMKPSALSFSCEVFFFLNAQSRLCRLWSSDDAFTAAMFCAVLAESPCSLFPSLPCRQTRVFVTG